MKRKENDLNQTLQGIMFRPLIFKGVSKTRFRIPHHPHPFIHLIPAQALTRRAELSYDASRLRRSQPHPKWVETGFASRTGNFERFLLETKMSFPKFLQVRNLQNMIRLVSAVIQDERTHICSQLSEIEFVTVQKAQ